MLDSTVVCRRALGCEWGGVTTDGVRNEELSDQGDQGKPGEPGHRNIVSKYVSVAFLPYYLLTKKKKITDQVSK